MFEILTDKLTTIFDQIASKGRLRQKDVDDVLRDIRMAFLEADVNFKVARTIVATIKERALSDEVLASLSPGQQVVKITNEELVAILDHGERSVRLGPNRPSTVLIVGLNGAGKTTTSAKLARHFREEGQKPLLVPADVHRPAAAKQLITLAEQIGVSIYQEENQADAAVEIVRRSLRRALELDAEWVVVDTAGRLHIDDNLMTELIDIKQSCSPVETLLVVDAMTGQDAVQAATDFNARLGITGLILTKMDGDSRGGAALSIAEVTGIPIKFIGMGEKLDALEVFHPDRLASRILGMGDVLTLIEKASATFDQDNAAELERKIKKSTFDLEDFLSQLQQLKNMGPISQILEMIPGMSKMRNQMSSEDLDGTHLIKTEAIIKSMTLQERRNPQIIDGSRRKRISKGSGTSPKDVNQLLNQFREAQKMIRKMSGGKGRFTGGPSNKGVLGL